ncbi:MAG: hypothetical protein ACFFC7_16705 [Candidatus Hermodarchaeota archaeon]
MRASNLLGISLVIFDHKKGSFVAGVKPRVKALKVLSEEEHKALIELISTKNYEPGDSLHKKFTRSKKQAYGQVFECKNEPRSDLFFFFLVVSLGVKLFELKTLMTVLLEVVLTYFPHGFTTQREGYALLDCLNPEQSIIKGDKWKLGEKEIPLRHLKILASHYGITDNVQDIISTQFE